MRILRLTILAAALVCGRASADVVLDLETRDLESQPPRTFAQQIQMTSDKLHVSGTAPDGTPYAMIYRADRKQMLAVMPATKSYMVLDAASMQQVGAQLDAVMEQMQAQLEQMPPEQRQMVEQMMKEKMPATTAPAKPAVEVRKSGAKETIAGYPCERYDVVADGVTQSELWVTGWKHAGVPKGSLDVFKSVVEFLDELSRTTPMLQGMAKQTGFAGLDQIDGLPVLVRQIEDGKPVLESRLQKVEQKRVDPAAFEVPAGYTKQAMPGVE